MRFSVLAMSAVALIGLSSVAHANIITNPDFAATNTQYPGYTSSTATPGDPNYIAGWTSVNSGSNTSAGPFWDNGNPAGHTTVGFLQGAVGNTATLTQIVSLTAGQGYTFSFLENSRNCCNYNGLTTAQAYPELTLTIGGVQVADTPHLASVGGSNPFILVTGTFQATTSGPQSFTFSSTSPGDGSSLVTGVNLAKTPEPSSFALLGTGLLGMGGLVRRKFGKA